jgi:hypothetical protein
MEVVVVQALLVHQVQVEQTEQVEAMEQAAVAVATEQAEVVEEPVPVVVAE